MPELEQVYDEDTVFALRGLLVEYFGSNLRNLMARGLLSDQEFQSDELLYLWALVLWLCVATPPPPVCAPTDTAQSGSGP